MSKAKSTRNHQPETEKNGTKPPATALEARFAAAQPRLGPQRQQLIRAILDNCEETSFLSSRELAKRYEVDSGTVVRTVQALGYAGFTDFSADLRQHMMTRITPYSVLKAATREQRSVADHIVHSLDKAADNLNALRANLDPQRIIEVAKLIHRSRHTLIIGADFADSLASYFAYGLVARGLHAEAVGGSEGNLQHKVQVLTAKDLLIAISFGQCLRVTVEAVRQARAQGVPTFGITDSDTTPLARYCDTYLIAPIVSPSFLTSYVAPVALISALHVACLHINPKHSLTQLKPTNKEYLSGSRWYREPKAAS